MARLVSQAKMGYYATPTGLFSAIFSYLKPVKHPVTILDPCAGEGEVLLKLKHYLGEDFTTTYGIELDKRRGFKAKEMLDHAIVGDFFQTTISNAAFSLIYLNPPYDIDSDSDTVGERTEKKFLTDSLKYLTPGGVLIYVVPFHVLAINRIADIIAYRLESVQVFKFPEDEYNFKQIVLFGIKKKESYRDEELANHLKELGTNDKLIPTIKPTEHPIYELPESKRKIIFRNNYPSDEELIRDIKSIGFHQDTLNKLYRPTIVKRPILPLRRGHLVTLLASGLINGVFEKDGKKVLLKGKTEKKTEKIKTEDETIYRDKIVSIIYGINEDGKLFKVS